MAIQSPEERRRRPRHSGAPLTQDQLNARLDTYRSLAGLNLEKLSFQQRSQPGCNMSRARLVKASLSRTQLQGSKFTEADLRGADLTGADLSDCDFSRADLQGARLAGAVLEGADLTSADGLTPDQLSATHLAGARLPAGFAFDGLDRVRELVNRAERILYILLLTCASVAVICGTTGADQLFRPSSALTLPGLDVPVTISAFYNLVPLLVLGIYLSLCLTLRKLWLELASLPARFQNHRWLYQEAAQSTPSFVSVVVPYLRGEPGHRADRLLMAGAVWWIAPPTLAWVHLTYLPSHRISIAAWHLVMLGAIAAIAIGSHRDMHAVLARSFGRVQVPWAVRRQMVARRRSGHRGTLTTRPASLTRSGWRVPRSLKANAGVIAAGLALALAGLNTYSAIYRRECSDLLLRSSETRTVFERVRPCSWNTARLGHSDLAGLKLHGGNLRRAFLHGANLSGAVLEDANLAHANLTTADLRRVNLKDATLRMAVLWEANLDSARVKEADFGGADVRGASLRFARVQGTSFSGADLRGVDWTNAVVCGAVFDPEKVDTTELRMAWGWQLAVGTGIAHRHGALDAPVDTAGPPTYLSDQERREYLRWRRAWLAVQHGPRLQPARTAARREPGPPAVVRRDLVTYLDTLDVSMGASRQRDKEALLREIRRMRPVGGDTTAVPYTPALADALWRFRERVRGKAENHCVDAAAA